MKFMKNGAIPSMINKKYVILFFIISLLYFGYCICIIPSYLLEKCLKYNDIPWTTIDGFFIRSFIKDVYDWLIYKIPDFTLIPAFLMNAGNMVWGFVRYKKKWWYYLLLAVSVLCSVLLLDYYAIYNDDV